MNDDLKKLYRTLGYAGPLPEGDAPGSFAAPSPAAEAAAGAAPALASDPAERPPLDAAGLNQLEEMLNREPNKTLARVREMWDSGMTRERLREAIAAARRAMAAPTEAVAVVEAENAFFAAAIPALPPGFTFPGMNDLPKITINPEDRKYENDDLIGVLGWIFGAGPFVLTQPSKKNFRFHSQDKPFIYDLEEPSPDKPLEIALFSDFGVGRYYSKFIARHIGAGGHPYAIHLGDVYYAGRSSEFRENFEDLLDPILTGTSLFTLNSNHEMYSEGKPYFDYIDKRAELHPGKQKQQGSYFCLRSEKFQIVGIDTAFFGHGRYRKDPLRDWLRNVLRDGRQAGRVNILLSADHPYEYGEKKLTKLLRSDLKPFVLEDRLVDLWFWGNTHYCALFDHKPVEDDDIPVLPFVGSCIGHGGYPYDTKKRGEHEPAPMLFLEDQSRFPGTNVRPDKGNNGYCVLRLNADGSMELQYWDWMKNQRFAASLARGQAGEPLRVTPI
ncbi:MAG: metallophosphoesterase [Blastocatellales bacterium]